MKDIFLDFVNIGDYEDFYAELNSKLESPIDFDENHKALTKMMTEDLEKPIHIEFVNMSVDQLESFEDLLTVLEELEEEVSDFSFAYYLEQYEDAEDVE